MTFFAPSMRRGKGEEGKESGEEKEEQTKKRREKKKAATGL